MEEKIKNSFDKQKFMRYIGARIVSIKHGELEIECEFHENLTQQHGYIHAGVLTTLIDVACGYAALTTMPEDMEVLSVEFKNTFIRPAKAEKIIAVGKVIKSGKRLTFCEGTVYDGKKEAEFAKMTATMICVKRRTADG